MRGKRWRNRGLLTERKEEKDKRFENRDKKRKKETRK